MLLLNSLLLIGLIAPPGEITQPGDYTRTTKVGGVERSYIVHVPTGYLKGNATPLVFCLHGAGMTAKMMQNVSGMSKKADEANFIVVFPAGTGIGQFLAWNSGGFQKGMGSRADDVAFIRQIIDELSKEVWIDNRHIHACGLSNGGMMSYRLASEMSDKIASIAIVGGTVALEECKPKRPVSVLHFHGTADPIVAFKMTEKNMPPVMKIKSVQDSIQMWVKLNGCAEKADVETISKPDDLKVVCKRHNNGKDNSEVILVEVEEGGHTWPGMPPPLKVFGKSAKLSANDLIWDFFQKHPLP